MDPSDLSEVLPHYLVMFLLVVLVLGVVRRVVGDLGFWVEFVIVGLVVFSYRPLVVRLGYAPRRWERD
ncbi:MAG: hypothetical protein ABEJ81_08505 [Haloferacaceae archaeon]